MKYKFLLLISVLLLQMNVQAICIVQVIYTDIAPMSFYAGDPVPANVIGTFVPERLRRTFTRDICLHNQPVYAVTTGNKAFVSKRKYDGEQEEFINLIFPDDFIEKPVILDMLVMQAIQQMLPLALAP